MYRLLARLAIICMITPTLVQGDQTSTAHVAIQAVYNALNQAAANKDINGVADRLDPSFVIIDLDGQNTASSRSELERYLGQIFTVAKNISDTVTITDITVQGKDATVTMREHLTYDVTNPLNGQSAHMDANNTCRDFWIQGNKGWIEKRSRVLASTHTLSGSTDSIHTVASPHYW